MSQENKTGARPTHQDESSSSSENKMQEEIRKITRNPSLSQAEKSEKVHQLYQSVIVNHGSATQTAPSENWKDATYNDEKNKILGCKHYKRACRVQCPDCKQYYTCRHCHNKEEAHEMNRHKISKMQCMKCNMIQDVGQVCKNPSCKATLARYYCHECKFFDDEEGRDIYHCKDCGICRLGKREDYFHCSKCGSCVVANGQSDHKCFNGSMDADCPVCNEYMFTSTQPVRFMRCGHCIHSSCYVQYAQYHYTCPVCRKSLSSMEAMFSQIENVLNMQQMPPEFKNTMTNILCNDCEEHSVARYHFVYHKCAKCGSYNTQVLSKFEKPGEVGEAAPPSESPPGGRSPPGGPPFLGPSDT